MLLAIQLTDTKAADGKTTLLHYIVCWVKINHAELLNYHQELSNVPAASKVNLNCTLEEMSQFVDCGRERVDGWISHYFGHTIEEHQNGAEPVGTAPDAPFRVTVAEFLKYWRDTGMIVAGTSPEKHVLQAKPQSAPQSASVALIRVPPSGPIVRGSVEQIHVADAKPNASVTVLGPHGFQATASADDRGGLILRDVRPGMGYSVTVGGSDNAPHLVRVLGREEHPENLIQDKWTQLRIELFPFAHVFREGSRIRLSVSGPGGAGNAWPWAFDTLPGGFEVRIAHDGKHHSSSVVLPVVEPTDLIVPRSLPERDRVWLQPSRAVD